MPARNVLCLDLGGTKLRGAVVQDGKLLRSVTVKTETGEGARSIEGTFRRLLSAFCEEEYGAVALSSAGEIDSDGRFVRFATELLPGYTGFDLGGFFARETGGKPFVCLNDGLAALLGECAARGRRTEAVAMLTLGTGVGGAVVREGAARGEALPLGHLPLVEGGRPCTCGRRGCIEQYVSGTALQRALASRGAACAPAELWARYREGDPVVCSAVQEWLCALAAACELVYEHIPFRLMILGGGVSDSGAAWFSDLKTSARFEVQLSRLGGDAGLFGAYAFYRQEALPPGTGGSGGDTREA